MTRAEVPALAAFLEAYLHEDLEVEHGSPQAALEAFRRDASEEELAALRRDAARLSLAVSGLSRARVRRLVASLGAAWRPRDVHELLGLLGSV